MLLISVFDFPGSQLVSNVSLNKWVLIVPQRDANNVDNLVRTIQQVSRPLGFNVANAIEM